MKNILTLSILLVLSLSSFAQTHSVYTAKDNGSWNALSTWTIVYRNDGVQKNKFIIPLGYTVTAGDDVNTMGLDDVELQISGVLKLAPSATLQFGDESRIEILSTGSIEGNGASQRIFIGGVSKYTGNVDKNLSGPLYSDFSTTGFVSYSLLSVNFNQFTGSINNDHSITLKWSVSNEINNKHYEVEACSNNNNWKKIGVVIANTNAAAVNAYQFNTNAVTPGTNTYRLKQIGQDGKSQYSNTISFSNKAAVETKIYAANKIVNIQLPAASKHTVAVKVINLNGFVVASQIFNQTSSKFALNINHLNSGAYVVYVADNMNMQTVTKIMVN